MNVNRIHILVVDDDSGQRSLLNSFLSHQGFTVTTAESGEEALTALKNTRFNMLISDVRMPGMSGLELMQSVRELFPQLPVLLVTAYADIKDAVGAMRDGAVNYLEKPIDLEELFHTVVQAIGQAAPAPLEMEAGPALPEGIIAQSTGMQAVFQEVALVAPSDTRVLITGESGSGKEVIADVLHNWSPRAQGPLVKVNCAAIPETLLESELFGHEQGAFTGATSQRVGRFEEAHSGTILLDEIGEMSPALQAKLLRITQDGSFQRIGSNEVHRTDARILAATNRNLEEDVEAGRFREDLFYRLNVIEVYVPPLRERTADILPLAHHYAALFSKGKPRFSPAATACLEHYAWPGNIRELRNAMERAILMARGDVVLPEHLPKRLQEACPDPASSEATLSSGTRMEDMERTMILRTLKEHSFNRTETAKVLGISRRALIYKIQRYREAGYQVELA